MGLPSLSSKNSISGSVMRPGVPPRISHLVYGELVEARARGVSMLLVDQNIAKAVEISDYLYMLEMGQVRRAGPRQAFADQLRELIRDALLGV